MPLWLMIVIPIAAFGVPLAERFYVRFFPDVDTQKRHLKKLVLWAFNTVSIGFQFWNLYRVSQEPLPKTTAGIVFIAVSASIAVALPVFIFGLYALSRVVEQMLNLHKGHLRTTSKVLDIVIGHEKALTIVSTTLPESTKEEVVKQLEAIKLGE